MCRCEKSRVGYGSEEASWRRVCGRGTAMRICADELHRVYILNNESRVKCRLCRSSIKTTAALSLG